MLSFARERQRALSTSVTRHGDRGASMIRAVSSTSAAARLDAAYAFLTDRPAGSETVIVGASRGAADDVARVVARRSGATFGVTRCSLIELAARHSF